MELKSHQGGNINVKVSALIVPLWNWNTGSDVPCFLDDTALIVPLWNWN